MGQAILVSYNSKYDVWKVIDNIDLEAIKDFIYHNFD